MSESIQNLKAWVHWKQKENDVSEDDLDFAKAVSDLISQVGTWKAKYDKARAQCEKLAEALGFYADAGSYIKEKVMQTMSAWDPHNGSRVIGDKEVYLSPIDRICFNKAREALAEYREGLKK